MQCRFGILGSLVARLFTRTLVFPTSFPIARCIRRPAGGATTPAPSKEIHSDAPSGGYDMRPIDMPAKGAAEPSSMVIADFTPKKIR